MNRLQGKTAIITGASTGIVATIATRCNNHIRGQFEANHYSFKRKK